MLNVHIHKTNKVVLALKRKKAKARTNAKKSNNTAFVRNPGVEKVCVLDLGIQKLSSKILGCLPSPYTARFQGFSLRAGSPFGGVVRIHTTAARERRREFYRGSIR